MGGGIGIRNRSATSTHGGVGLPALLAFMRCIALSSPIAMMRFKFGVLLGQNICNKNSEETSGVKTSCYSCCEGPEIVYAKCSLCVQFHHSSPCQS